MKTRLHVLSYNIHKGFTASNLEFVLGRMKSSIEEVHADLVMLQEVVGHHEAHRNRVKDWPTVSQFEYIADRLWPHHAYGKNAVYASGHHGNAVLSKFPILSWENQDVSPSRLERRGLLHAIIDLPGRDEKLHAICVHLALFEMHRSVQIQELCKRIASMVPRSAPLIVGGDFNDWRGSATSPLRSELGLEEAFLELSGSHARTFPSWFPMLRLDRLYYRGMSCGKATAVGGGAWKDLSDHLPLIAEFEI